MKMKNFLLIVLILTSVTFGIGPRPGQVEGYPPNYSFIEYATPDPEQVWEVTGANNVPVGSNQTLPVNIRVYNWRSVAFDAVQFDAVLSRGGLASFVTTIHRSIPPGQWLDTTINIITPNFSCICTLYISVARYGDSVFSSRYNPVLVVGDTIPPVLTFTYPRNMVDSIAQGSQITVTWTLTDQGGGIASTTIYAIGATSFPLVYNGPRTSCVLNIPANIGHFHFYTGDSSFYNEPFISVFAKDSNGLQLTSAGGPGYPGRGDTVKIYDPPPKVTLDKSKKTANMDTKYMVRDTVRDQLSVIATSLYIKTGVTPWTGWTKLDSHSVHYSITIQVDSFITPPFPSTLCSLIVSAYDTNVNINTFQPRQPGVGRDTLVITVTSPGVIPLSQDIIVSNQAPLVQIYDIRGKRVSACRSSGMYLIVPVKSMLPVRRVIVAR
jgi:hypothetical protein